MTNPEATGDLPRVLRGDAVGNTMYSERWILKQLIKITKYISGEEEFNDDFEIDLCKLWDMCADKEVIAFTKKHGLIALSLNVIMKTPSPRLTEIMVGIIGNMCTLKSVREECKQKTDVIKVMMDLLAFPDSPTLIQVMRVLQTFAWEVTNSCQSPRARRNEDQDDDDEPDNDHNDGDHNNDYENGYYYDPLHMYDEYYTYEEYDSTQKDNDANNQSQMTESDSSEESSLSDNMEVIPTLSASSEKPEDEVEEMNTEGKSDERTEADPDQDMIGNEEIGMSFPSTNTTSQSQESANENENIASSSGGEESKTVDINFVEMMKSCSPELSVGEITMPVAGLTVNVDFSEVLDLSTGASPSAKAYPKIYIPEVLDLSKSAASTSDMGNLARQEGTDEGATGGGPSAAGAVQRCAGNAWRNIEDIDYEDDDVGDDENPEVVTVSVNDGSVIIGTAFLWYEQFIKTENWLPEIVYILNSSKNAELIGLTWTLLSALVYIRVGGADKYLGCNIKGPDIMRGLLESFKEFFGQYADLDNSELHDVKKCRKGLFSWTSVMYSFTFHEDCESSCGVFKADIMKNIFQMLTFFTHFLPLDGDLHEYLIHSYTILDHVLMSEPYEMSSFRTGINGIIQLRDYLTEIKKRQNGDRDKEETKHAHTTNSNSTDPRPDVEAIDTTERYLMNVLLWLTRMNSENRFGEFEDIRKKLAAKFG